MARQPNGVQRLALATALLVLLMSTGVLCVADGGWRARVAPSLLARFDAYESGMQNLWVHVSSPEGPIAATLGGNHAYRALSAWGQLNDSGFLNRLAEIASPSARWVMAHPGRDFWEAPLPYFLSSGTLWVQSDLADLQELAETPGVTYISDAELPAPIGRPSRVSMAENDEGMDLAALFEKTGVPAEDLGHLILDQEGVLLTRAQIVEWGASASEAVLSALPALDADLGAFKPVSYALLLPSLPEGFTPTAAVKSELAPWKSALAQGDLRQLLDLLNWEGADVVTLLSMEYETEEVPLAVLWRSTTPSALSSLEGGPSTVSFLEPESPNELLVTQGAHEDQVVVLWPETPGIAFYEILRADREDGVYAPVAVVDDTTYVDRHVETCSITWYRIRAVDAHGLGEPTQPGFGYIGKVPFPVQEIRADGGSIASAIRVEWNPVDGATHYRLLRTQYMTGSTRIKAQNYSVTTTSDTYYVDTDVVVGQKYFYRVFALNGCGRSSLSRPTEGIAYFSYPSTDPLSPPPWIEATRGAPYGQVKLTWTQVPGAAEYRILRALAYEGPYEPYATTTDLRFVDTDVELCGDYWYRIQTVLEAGVSDPSVSAYGSFGYRPVAPDHIRASIGAYPDSIRVEWAPVNDALNYNIQRAPAEEGPYTPIASTQELFFIDQGLGPGQEFWYAVLASNPCGCSGAKESTMGTTAYE